LLGRTLRRERFRESYGAQVPGINHHGTNVIRKLRDVPLRLGDVLLLQGSPESLNRLQESGVARILGASEAMEDVRPRLGRAPLAIGIFVAVLALVTARVLSLPLAVMLGTLLVFITRCITPEEAYARVEWGLFSSDHLDLCGHGAYSVLPFAWHPLPTNQPLLLLTVF
jgi:di/tricarboxylate transporter